MKSKSLQNTENAKNNEKYSFHRRVQKEVEYLTKLCIELKPMSVTFWQFADPLVRN